MQQRFTRMADLASRPGRPGRYPNSPATIWRRVNRGTLPTPIKLSSNTSVIPNAELDAIDAACAAAKSEDEVVELVRQLVRARSLPAASS